MVKILILISRTCRYHNVYGPFGTWHGGREKAPAAICRKVIEAKMSGKHEIEIWGDGEQTRSFMFIDDCITGMELMWQKGDLAHSTLEVIVWFLSISLSIL